MKGNILRGLAGLLVSMLVLGMAQVGRAAEDPWEGLQQLMQGEQQGGSTDGYRSGGADGKQPSPEEIGEMMSTLMVPMMGEMMDVMITGMAQAFAKQEVSENFATFTRQYYDALVNRGFTDEEAMRIVTSAGLPSTGMGSK